MRYRVFLMLVANSVAAQAAPSFPGRSVAGPERRARALRARPAARHAAAARADHPGPVVPRIARAVADLMIFKHRPVEIKNINRDLRVGL